MQTQRISLATPDLSGKVSVKSEKVTGNSFDSYIANRGSKAGNDADFAMKKEPVRPVDVKNRPTGDKFAKVTSGKSGKDKGVSAKVGNDAGSSVAGIQSELNEESVTVVVTAVMVVFQTNFQLPMDDIRDIMEQAGFAVEDYLQTLQDGVPGIESMEMMQNLVMKFHGITDKGVVLTDDSLTEEIGSLVDQVSQALTETMQALTDIEVNAVGAEDLNAADHLDVIVEKQTSGDSEEDGPEDDHSDQTVSAASVPDREVHTTEQSAGAQFVDRLSQAFEQSDVEEISNAQQTMTRIVEQVVTQVRIRVMQSTTSMELQLHPASLGRVNLQVATAAGVSTALLTVETQAAKEALESQLITLKQTFEQQGLKVNEVEVAVSEFGLGEHNREADREQQNSGGRNRRFRFKDEDSEGISDEEIRETSTERRDVNSMVDYTA